jgi:hypothetical protein
MNYLFALTYVDLSKIVCLQSKRREGDLILLYCRSAGHCLMSSHALIMFIPSRCVCSQY